ncbi:MAG: CHASE2 domain-containing protein [Cyanobacteria bacterium P01_F01_bin.150]
MDRSYVRNLPGCVGIGLVVVARLVGLLQPLELDALDVGLRWRSPEPTDDRIVIVGINETDLQSVDTYPIPDEVLAQLLQQLQTYNPQVIGLDIVRDVPVEPGHAQLVEAFTTIPNIIGGESIFLDRIDAVIAPPPSLPPEQIGFVDSILDDDGHQRRAILGGTNQEGEYRFSMAIQLASAYLSAQGIELSNGIKNPVSMRFGDAELPVVSSNLGGYVRADAGGNQTLINFRSGQRPFRQVSLLDMVKGDVDPEWFRDRIVLIGITATSKRDYERSAAIASSNPGLVFGVELHAHTVSQIVSAALDGRSLLRTWSDGWEYLWIIAWGLVGMGIGQWVQRPIRHFLWVGSIMLSLMAASYGFLAAGWWIPIVPALTALLINGVLLYSFYLYDQTLQSRIRDRQLVIEQTFTTIHNGPLQTLAGMRRELDEPSFSKSKLEQSLGQLNQELRGIYDAIQQDAIQDNRLHLQGQAALDLTTPLHELLHEVYFDTLQRNFPGFTSLKAHIVTFEPFEENGLTAELKRELCRFLEEALCNVGKHASGARRLTIDCQHNGNHNLIRVIDNGSDLNVRGEDNIEHSVQKSRSLTPQLLKNAGRGTQQAEQLANKLRGNFNRSAHSPQGTCCELSWQPQKSILTQLKHHIIAVFGKVNHLFQPRRR